MRMPKQACQQLIYGIVLATLAACQPTQVPAPKPAVPTKPVAKGDVLWHFVADQCVPHFKSGQQPPTPCIKVDLQQGYVIFKDRNGPLQYLHMPTDKITGLEDPKLLSMKRTPFFAQAWRERRYMDRLLGASIPTSEYAFTLNSRSGRTQNQLHIHISCIKPDLRDRLHRLASRFGAEWQAVPGGINGRSYQARSLTLRQLEQIGAIRMVADTLANQADLADYSLALYPLSDSQFLLFATHGMFASSEGDFQDHRCQSVLKNASR